MQSANANAHFREIDKRRITMNKPLTAKQKVPFNTRVHNTLVYLRQHWQLYLIFMLPAFVLTIIFRYIPMGPRPTSSAI